MQEEARMAAMEGDPEEMESMLPKEKSENKEGPGPEDYVEKKKFCYCFSTKCGIIFIGILLCFDFVLEVFDVAEVGENEYFDPIYFDIYLVLLLAYAAAVILYLWYFVTKDSPSSRSKVPIALLIAGIVNTLIVIWIVVYIMFIYKRDKVYVSSGKASDDDSGWYEDENPGDKKKKMKYVK